MTMCRRGEQSTDRRKFQIARGNIICVVFLNEMSVYRDTQGNRRCVPRHASCEVGQGCCHVGYERQLSLSAFLVFFQWKPIATSRWSQGVSSKMDNILDLCWDVFPWISIQATRLGLEMQDNRFAQLGGQMFILSQQNPPSGQREIHDKLLKVVTLVNKACSVSEIVQSV